MAVEVIWRVVSEGHRLGNHGQTHDPYLPDLSCSDALEFVLSVEDNIKLVLLYMEKTRPDRYFTLSPDTRNYVNQIIKHGTGILRPPGGKITGGQLEDFECSHCTMPSSISCDQNLCVEGLSDPFNVYRWDIDPQDWWIDSNNLPPEMILERIQNGWIDDGPMGIAKYIIGRSGPWGSFGVMSNDDNILLHSNHAATVIMLEDIVIWLKSEGYTFDLLEPDWMETKSHTIE